MAGVKHIAVWLQIWRDPKKAMTASQLVRAGFGDHHPLLNTLKQLVSKGMLGMGKVGKENEFFIKEEHVNRLSDEPYVSELLALGWQFENDRQ